MMGAKLGYSPIKIDHIALFIKRCVPYSRSLLSLWVWRWYYLAKKCIRGFMSNWIKKSWKDSISNICEKDGWLLTTHSFTSCMTAHLAYLLTWSWSSILKHPARTVGNFNAPWPRICVKYLFSFPQKKPVTRENWEKLSTYFWIF